MRILHVLTVPMSLTFLRGQVDFMKSRGVDIHVLCSRGEELATFGREEAVTTHAVEMTRRITPLRDLAALIEVWHEVRRLQPQIVHAHTPKGGLLGMLAAFLSGTRLRIYHMRGLPFGAATGTRRFLSLQAERLSCRLSHVVLCNSESLRREAIEARVCRAEKIRVLAGGSGNGVDATGRFDPNRLSATARAETRRRLGISSTATVIGFVGRVVKEKGVEELEEAWQELSRDYSDVHLMIVGPLEAHDPISEEVLERLQAHPRVHLLGMDWNTPPLYAAMDIVALPSYREGFPNVPLEAAAMRLPVVATRVPGCVDAVEDGETGLLAPARDAAALSRSLRAYLEDEGLRASHGEAGRARVLRSFRQEDIWNALYDTYVRGLRTSRPSGHGVKRAFDLVGSTLGLIVLAPILAALALFVRARLGSPVFFRQERAGLDGSLFTLVKFRTMVDERDGQGRLLSDEERLTPFGSFLRRTSLDELPELWNVLKGEMSLVGPRPLLPEYLPLYTPSQARRHEVRPGLTGWAQINGRNSTTWEKRLTLDVWYVDHCSLRLDFRIMLSTLKKVVSREGIHQEGVATMERFRGSAV